VSSETRCAATTQAPTFSWESTYWNGEAMQTIDYQDLAATPAKTAATNAAVAKNAAHLARLLSGEQYPAQG